MRSRGTFLPRSTFSKNGSTSSCLSGPPKETTSNASNEFMGSRDSKSSPSQNLTTDYTDNTDLHGSKEFSKTILTLQIHVIPGSSVAGFAFMEVITSFMSNLQPCALQPFRR